MLIRGQWYLCEDGIERPVVLGEIFGGEQSWVQVPFLLDTGADRTVLSAPVLSDLNLRSSALPGRLGGVGGLADSVAVKTQIRLPRSTGENVVFRGQYAAITELESLDMSVLGRDVTDLFAVIVDRPGDVVCLMRDRHRYVIRQA